VGLPVNARLELISLGFENNCVKISTDRAAIMQIKDSSFWQYKVYAVIRRGSLERRRQTTVGSRVNARTAVACILP